MKLHHVRIELGEANAFVAQHHRHHMPVVGHLFSLGAVLGDKIVGVCIVGRPVARRRDDGMTAEVTRLCTDGTKNACSFLYGAAARAAFALGFTRIGDVHPRQRTRGVPDGGRLAADRGNAGPLLVGAITPARRYAPAAKTNAVRDVSEFIHEGGVDGPAMGARVPRLYRRR